MNFEGFDEVCDEWADKHPGQAVPMGELFAQYMSDETGHAVIGGPIGEPPSVVAVPA